MNRSTLVQVLRDLEMLYRKIGAFEAAVQAQEHASHIDSLGPNESGSMASWFHRGAECIPGFDEHEGMFGLVLPSRIVLWLTQDVAGAVAVTLATWCGIFPPPGERWLLEVKNMGEGERVTVDRTILEGKGKGTA